MPSQDLLEYAGLLRWVGRTTEAEGMMALADAYDRAERVAYERAQRYPGGDWRGRSSVLIVAPLALMKLGRFARWSSLGSGG
jgi:hypothetical protein